MHKQLVTILSVMVFSGCALLAQETGVTEDTDATITHLLDVVAKADCSFIRNGKAYTGAQAADHLRTKYKHFKDQIKTPEDFIRLAATESLLTGEAYKVKPKDGQETTSAAWMMTLLMQHRQHEIERPTTGTTNNTPRIGA
ncbi:MAG: DUF5329 family protein [bacterium]